MSRFSAVALFAVFVLALTVSTAVPLAGAAPAAQESEKDAQRTHTVRIKGMAFVPATLEVSVGDKIVWVNEDFVPHTATAIVDGVKVFDSGVFQPKASWTYVADKAGTYPYVCLLHPTMKATLIVR